MANDAGGEAAWALLKRVMMALPFDAKTKRCLVNSANFRTGCQRWEK